MNTAVALGFSGSNDVLMIGKENQNENSEQMQVLREVFQHAVFTRASRLRQSQASPKKIHGGYLKGKLC